jgi:O-methyltransferase
MIPKRNSPLHNFFIIGKPFGLKQNDPLVSFVNKTLRHLRFNYQLNPLPNPVKDMNTIEQRINFFLLLENIIANKTEGDVVELGCFTGHCAMLFQKTIEIMQSNKQLHLYDSFTSQFTIEGSVLEVLKENFKEAELEEPIIHKGFFTETVPQELPEVISFAHIDCGFAGDPLKHKEVVRHCLDNIYPRMSIGAICILMDYHDNLINNKGFDANPGVKLACDEFLADKKERMISLFGNQYSHGFFRKISLLVTTLAGGATRVFDEFLIT